MDILAATFSSIQCNHTTSVQFGENQQSAEMRPTEQLTETPVSFNKGEVDLFDTYLKNKPEKPGFSLYDNKGSRSSYERTLYESLEIEYTSKDGDTAYLKYQKMEYSKDIAYAAVAPSAEQDEAKEMTFEELLDKMESIFANLKQLILEAFIESTGGEYQPIEKAEKASVNGEMTLEELEEKMPEFWNAENTSQRIVDFAISFAGAFGGDDPEGFVETIKNAISTGYSQARETMGEVPGAVAQLSEKTFDLTMQKLDNWAAGQKAPQPEELANVA